MENDLSLFETQISSQKPLYFIHPHNKFWEVSVLAENVTYRAGKLKNSTQLTSDKVQKRYSSDYVAKRTVKEKIRQKMVKGYIILQGSKPQASIQKPNEAIRKTIEIEDKLSKKEQKQQKKKIKAVINQLEERCKFNSINQTLNVPAKNSPILPQDTSQTSKQHSTYLMNQETSEGIQYELIDEKKVKITKFLKNKNCGYEIKSFESKQQTMKFIFGERQWLKSQGYSQQQCKEIQPETKMEYFGKNEKQKIIKQQPGKSSQKSQKKSKSAGLVARTDQCLTQYPKLKHYDNNPLTNKEDPMLGPPSNGLHIKLMLAQTWKQGTDPKGWLISQKLDGVRCYWTGSEMFSRNGNKFEFPNFFVKNWPKAQLDGELFIGRGKFSHTISTVKRLNPVNSMWENVRFLVFDAPGLKCSFKQRYRIIKEVIQKTDNPYIKCHFHRQCKGFHDMFKQLDHINKVEGQGIMLRDPLSLYEFKRSKALLKVKTFHDDEATIVGYNEGTGRFVGHIGSLKCINKAGAYFDVGSGLNDEMRYNPPKVGQKIVYKYQELNKETGRPRFPTFLRMFEDESTTQCDSGMGWVKDDDKDADF